MIAAQACQEIMNRLGAYVDRALTDEECNEIEAHLCGCKTCRDSVRRFASVQRLLAGTYNAGVMGPALTQKTGQRLLAVLAERPGPFLDIPEMAARESFLDRLRLGMGAAPWWGVSIAMHVLVILLAGLISMSIELPKPEDSVIIVTELAKHTEVSVAEPVKEKLSEKSALASKHETPPTDPTSKEMSDIVVPPDILAKAELGDHFETINPDRPDTHDAFGNPDSHFFYSVKGCDEPEGGGGTGGTSLDDLIGVGGASSPGSGGGWGGGHGTGIGVGTGSGRGSFGNRNGGGRRLMVKRHGGSSATESAVDKALEWLARHQEPEGKWAAEKYADNIAGARHGGGGLETVRANTVGVTGLALLAFLGAGHSLKVGKYRDNVKRGVEYLIKHQAADGHLAGSGCSISTSYCHDIATLALAEAYGMGNAKVITSYEDEAKGNKDPLAGAIEKALGLIYSWQDQNPQGGWSYGPASPIDPTVSGWAVMALKSAKVAGFKIPAERMLKALDAIKTICTVDAGKGDYGRALTGYRAKGGVSFGSKGYACTAAGLVIHLFLGVDPADSFVQAAASTITQDEALPDWIFKPQDPSTDHQNLYYWYYGTLGSFQAGGDYWKKWNKKMKDALLPHQCKGGALDGSPQDHDGSWDPDDVWGAWGGRVYSTALGALCMEVYYRYARLTDR